MKPSCSISRDDAFCKTMMAPKNKSLARTNKSSDVGKATKGCSDLPACRADRAEFLASHSALLTCPGLQWLGLFPFLAAMNKFLA
jgi:hypothetical protein